MDGTQVLQGKVALITGAAKGIGWGCAQVLGRAGAIVGLVDIDSDSLANAERLLRDHGVTAMSYCANVSVSDEVDRTVYQLVEKYGGLDIVINNAGTHDGKSIEQATEADWDRVIDTNLKSVFLVSKAALPHLKTSGGAIVNMSSMVGLVGQSNACAYAASKGGIIALTKNMALDLAPYRIRVNCICPGWVETPLVQTWFSLQPDEVAARNYIYSVHPLGRIATPEDIGHAALFLASDQGSFVTGVALPVDGGVALGY